MIKIADLEVGQRGTFTFVLVAAVARETKAKKPYLQMEFFDGTDKISGNYWDWATGKIPPKNTILNVEGQITEWQGAKQLNIKTLSTNTEMHLSEFVPTSIYDIPMIFKNSYELLSNITNDTLRTLALGIIEELESKWLYIPAAKVIHHAYVGGTLIHSYSVACIAGNIAEAIPDANKELCVVGGFLHDVGKLFCYDIDGVAIDLTSEGLLFEHAFVGAEFLSNYADSHVDVNTYPAREIVEMLKHIILSHHGKQEYGAAVPPSSLEAHIISHADGIDAVAEQIRDASSKVWNEKFTDRIWALENRPHLTYEYVNTVMSVKGE